jgi:hypothetical protein
MALKSISALVDNQKDCLDVIIDTTGNLIFKILTVHGRFIKTVRQSLQEQTDKVSVNLADLSSGDYVLNVFIDNSFLRSFRFNKN